MTKLVFRGLEGANPLAFLAALGTVRLCDSLWSDVRLRWVRDGGWRPEMAGLSVKGEQEFCRMLHEQLNWAPLCAFGPLGKNLTVPPQLFREVVESVNDATAPQDRRAADFAAAFGSEALQDKNGRIQITALCFITGSGHQDFLGTANGLAASCGPDHLREALFGPWGYANDGLSLRWDPDDAKEYALRWRNPSIGGVSCVWGANRLAFEALPLFPTAPEGGWLRTTGFQRRSRTEEFTWPIWPQFAGMDTIRSLLTLPQIQEDVPERGSLRAMGIDDVFRVQRVRIGQGANFKVSFRPARAV
jgi:hypothetical protein